MTEFQPKSVLIIDDTRIAQQFVEAFFKRLKFNVYVASDGYEGLRIALSSKPDLILLDIMMPRLDGFKTLQVIKSNELTKNIPVVVMTAYSDKVNVVSASKLGALTVVTKPLTEDILFEKVRLIFGEEFVKSLTSHDHENKENPFGVNEEEYDNVVRGMVEEFLKYYAEQIGELEQAIQNKDIDVIRRVTHNIRGTSGSFGYGEATRLASRLNEMVHASSVDWDQVERIFVKLKNRLQR